METLIKKIQELIFEDQKNIKLFRGCKISQEEMARKSQKISKKFLEILNVYGFPYKNAVPEDIYKAGIALSLHLDLEDMQYVFDKFIENFQAEKIDPIHKAFFIDKMRVVSGKPQLYGTQYKIGKDKKIEMLPIENHEELEDRRKKAGLPPLSEYLDSIKIS